MLKVIVFPFMIQEQLIASSFCKIRGWSILIQSFAKFIIGDIMADTAILGNASKKEPLCSCNEHTSRVLLQLYGTAAEKKALSVRRIGQLATILEEQSSVLDWIHISHF